jgi:hypothetical protein
MDVERPRRIEAVHAGQRIERDAEPLQHLRRRIDGVERRRAALGDPVAVVNFARAVDGQAHQEAVLVQEARPVLVEQRAIGLQVVFDPLPGLGMLLLQRHHLVEELEAGPAALTITWNRRRALSPSHCGAWYLSTMRYWSMVGVVMVVPWSRPAFCGPLRGARHPFSHAAYSELARAARIG